MSLRECFLVVLFVVALPIAAFAYPGQVDSNYATNGVAKIDLGYTEAIGCGVLDSSKRLVLGGAIEGNEFTGSDMLIVRLRRNGTLDTGNFGGDLDGDMVSDGFVTLDLDLGSDESVVGIVLDDLGRIYAIGVHVDLGGTYRPIVTRFLADGTLDTTFGPAQTAGTVFFCQSGYSPVDARRDSSGNMYVCGTNFQPTPDAAQYSILEPGGDAIVDCSSHSPSGFTLAEDSAGIALQPSDGKVCVAGGTANDLYVSRLSSTTLAEDPTFDGDGHAFLSHIGVSNNPATIISVADLAIDPKAGHAHYNKCVVAGSADGKYLLTRFTEDGGLDSTFSGDGIQTVDIGGADWGRAVAIDGKGRVIIAGETDGDIGLARLKGKGKLDDGFGPTFDGKVVTPQNGKAHVRALLINKQAKRIFVIGSWGTTPRDILVVRYLGR